MPSALAWLDSSREEQRRMRELLALFADSESRDELGIGQVRDAFSDRLFPGTSTLHTRARYLLIVPWCFQVAERRGLRGAALWRKVDGLERQLIAVLKRAGAPDGMIGRRAGIAVKTLPSSVYWSALERYGIRFAEEPPLLQASDLAADRDSGELADRAVRMWRPTIPPPPPGFPDSLDGGLELTRPEAQWLHERMRDGAAGSLLDHILATEHWPDPNSSAPWSDPTASGAPEPAATDLRQAQIFSVHMHGAALLYNLMIARRYVAAGHERVEDPEDRYLELLQEWADLVDASGRPTDRTDMWGRLVEMNPRINQNLGARAFIDRWLDAVADGSALATARSADPDRTPLATLVADRERMVKKAQSRLVNETMLRNWSGASGFGLLTFRWAQVRRIVQDIRDGLEADEEAPARAAS